MTTQELDSAIVNLRQRQATQRLELEAANADLAGWQRALATDQANNATAGTLANTNNNIERARNRVRAATDALSITEEELSNKLELREAIESAATSAIRNGVSPDEAYRLAEADVIAQQRRTKLFNILTIVLALAILAAIIWWWRKRKK
jgi:hypothetical protein